MEKHEQSSYSRRLLRDIVSLCEAYPQILVYHNFINESYREIVVCSQMTAVHLVYGVSWPFEPPIIEICSSGYRSTYSIKNWSPVYDLRTTYYQVSLS